MSKVNFTSGKKDATLTNVKKMIGDAETFTVEYSSKIVYVIIVTNEMNQIQNYVPPIAWVVITREDQGVVEDVIDDFAAPNKMENLSTQKKHCFLQGVLFF